MASFFGGSRGGQGGQRVNFSLPESDAHFLIHDERSVLTKFGGKFLGGVKGGQGGPIVNFSLPESDAFRYLSRMLTF